MKKVFLLLFIFLGLFSCSTDSKIADHEGLVHDSSIRFEVPTVGIGLNDIELPCTKRTENMNCIDFERSFTYTPDLDDQGACGVPEEGCEIEVVLSGVYCYSFDQFNLIEYKLKSWSASPNCSEYFDCIMNHPDNKNIIDELERKITDRLEGVVLAQLDRELDVDLYDCTTSAHTTEVVYKRSICSNLCIYRSSPNSNLQYYRTACDYSCCMRVRTYCRNKQGNISVSSSKTILHDDCGDTVVSPFVRDCEDFAIGGGVVVDYIECSSDPCE